MAGVSRDAEVAVSDFPEAGELRPLLQQRPNGTWLVKPETADALGYFTAIGLCLYAQARAADKGTRRLHWPPLELDAICRDPEINEVVGESFEAGRQNAWPWRGFDHPGTLDLADRWAEDWRRPGRVITSVNYTWMRAVAFFSTAGLAEVLEAADPVQELWRMENDARRARQSLEDPS